MNILGYIVTDKKLKNIDGFVEQVNNIELVDSTKPILVIGWKNAKKYSGYTSILDKKLGDGVYWTFSRQESRVDFENDLQEFYHIIYNNILNNIHYYYVNILRLRYNKIKKLYSILNSKEGRTIYISNDFIYIPYKNNTLGLSLKILEYCGVKSSKVISRIKSNPKNKIIEDNNKYVFKLTKMLGDKKYALPHFISNDGDK